MVLTDFFRLLLVQLTRILLNRPWQYAHGIFNSVLGYVWRISPVAANRAVAFLRSQTAMGDYWPVGFVIRRGASGGISIARAAVLDVAVSLIFMSGVSVRAPMPLKSVPSLSYNFPALSPPPSAERNAVDDAPLEVFV